ncbi:MAG: sugar phosphate isomerase/epimerase [Candidatus Micrarchaeota archaeon]|nr:sugar phosphate isomerase/epimerase [Candidatus Micrarchaeota archaeon]
MLIGAMNNPHKKLVEEIHVFGELNFDYVEITIENPQARPEFVRDNKKKILDALGSYNLGVTCHLPWYFSLAHPYERIQKAVNAEFNDAFRAAAGLGAKSITLHTETMSPSIQGRKSHVQGMIASLKALHKDAKNLGLDLLVENLDSKSLSIEEFKQVFSEVDMGMTLDIGHTNTARGEGFENYWKAFHSRVRHVHLHDNFGANDDHLPLGAGKMDVEKVVGLLKEKYDGTITLEVHSEDRHYLDYSRKRLEILWYGRAQHEANQDYLYPKGASRPL